VKFLRPLVFNIVDSSTKLQVQEVHCVVLMTQKSNNIYSFLKENMSLKYTSTADRMSRHKTRAEQTVVQAS
jgi:hypothetical protein